MLEIKNTKIYDLEDSVIASGNAMRLEPEEVNLKNFDKSLERCKKLAKKGGGTGHSNFRTGILVSFDLKYPQYFTKQAQRYHFLQYVSSTSMMHRITKMDFSECCNKYVSFRSKGQMNNLIYWYNVLVGDIQDGRSPEEVLGDYRHFVEESYNEIPNWSEFLIFPDPKKDPNEAYEQEPFTGEGTGAIPDLQKYIYDCYMRIISNCPMGAELWVHCSTNYEQLATIYRQRKNHKLKEDWGEFCAWIESLPYAKELIICE